MSANIHPSTDTDLTVQSQKLLGNVRLGLTAMLLKHHFDKSCRDGENGATDDALTEYIRTDAGPSEIMRVLGHPTMCWEVGDVQVTWDKTKFEIFKQTS